MDVAHAIKGRSEFVPWTGVEVWLEAMQLLSDDVVRNICGRLHDICTGPGLRADRYGGDADPLVANLLKSTRGFVSSAVATLKRQYTELVQHQNRGSNKSSAGLGAKEFVAWCVHRTVRVCSPPPGSWVDPPPAPVPGCRVCSACIGADPCAACRLSAKKGFSTLVEKWVVAVLSCSLQQMSEIEYCFHTGAKIPTSVERRKAVKLAKQWDALPVSEVQRVFGVSGQPGSIGPEARLGPDALASALQVNRGLQLQPRWVTH